MRFAFFQPFFVLILSLTIVACGGGGGPSGNPGSVEPPATIASFTANNNRVIAGSTVELIADFNNGSAVIDNGVGSVMSNMPISTSALSHTTRFTLAVTSSGGAASRSLTVNVPDRYAPTSGDLGQARAYHTATRLANGKVLIIGGQNGSGYLSSAELYDPSSGEFVVTGSLVVARANHSASLLANGQVLVVGGNNSGGYLASAELYDPASGSFSNTDNITGARANHSATLLNNGKVLIAGGSNGTAFDTAQLYNPATGLFEASINLFNARQQHTATLLADGKVLLASGSTSYGSGYLTSSEIFDPTANGGLGSFTASGNLGTPRSGHSAALMADGRVMIVGGFNGTYLASVERFDPAGNGGVGSFVGPFNILKTAHAWHSMAMLANGKLLIAGGHAGAVAAQALSEICDPATFVCEETVTLFTARANHSSTLLANDQVLMVGGEDNGVYISASEFFDPATGASTVTRAQTAGAASCPALSSPPYTRQAEAGQTCLVGARKNHSATLLPNGKVLIAGGSSGSSPSVALSSAELYDPFTGIFTATGSLNSARSDHSATLLSNGKVLLAGGSDRNLPSPELDSAELYDPTTGLFSYTTAVAGGSQTRLNNARSTHAAILLDNGKVLLAGGETDTAELYDPVTGDFSFTANTLSSVRVSSAAALLANGKVLISGGHTVGGAAYLNSADLYDPLVGTNGTFSPTGSMNETRAYHASTRLPNGKVLITAGFYGLGVGRNTAELYDPASGSFSMVTSNCPGTLPATIMCTNRAAHLSTLLPNGLVLIAGGYNDGGVGKSAELFNPATNDFFLAGALSVRRGFATATLLPSGGVLIVGGDNVVSLPTAEVFNY